MSNTADEFRLSLERLIGDAEMDAETRAAFADVLAAIRVHGRELLAYPGVVSVRPGYRFRGARITPQPAVRVAVWDKRDLGELPTKDLIPRRLGKVLVDVVPASPPEQLEHLWRAQAGYALDGGAGVVHTTFVGAETPAEGLQDQPLSPYVPPPGRPLEPVTGPLKVSS